MLEPKPKMSQRDFLTERGAQELLGIIEANTCYKAIFHVEKSVYGLFVIRSNLLRGLPREKEDEKRGVLHPRGDLQPKANGGARRRDSGKVHDGGA
jgi:hypothetical protein